MATSYTITWYLSLLILAAVQGCCGEDQDTPDHKDAAMVAAMREVSQTLKSISFTMQEGLRLHIQNTASLRDLHSLPDMILEVKEEIQKHNEELNSVKGEKEALKKVIVLTQENTDLKIQWMKNDQEVDKLSQEITELRKQLHNKDLDVDKLNQEITELKKQLDDKDLNVKTLSEDIREHEHLLADKDDTVQKLDSELTKYQRHVQDLENQVQELNNTVESQVACFALGKIPEQLQEIKKKVHVFIDNKDWDMLKRDLNVILDQSSEEYKQLQEAESVWKIGYYNYTQLASLLLCAGLPVDTTNSKGNTMLQGAASGGQLQLVKLLHRRGAGVNVRGNNRRTPLIRAAHHGHLEVVQWLVQNGADTTARDKEGYTALHWAKSASETAVAKYLEQLPH